METLGVLDIIWRVAVAGALAIAPGVIFWTVVFGLMAARDRMNKGQRRLPDEARSTVSS